MIGGLRRGAEPKDREDPARSPASRRTSGSAISNRDPVGAEAAPRSGSAPTPRAAAPRPPEGITPSGRCCPRTFEPCCPCQHTPGHGTPRVVGPLRRDRTGGALRSLTALTSNENAGKNPGRRTLRASRRALGRCSTASRSPFRSGGSPSRSCSISSSRFCEIDLHPEQAPVLASLGDMMADPVSGLQIEQGWNVVSADGTLIGTVAQVAGDPRDDIFDRLALPGGSPAQLRYVPGEQVGGIFPGEVTLKITASESGAAWKRRS